MTQQTMYPVKTIKPVKTTADITQTDTQLQVDDIREFPTAPNIVRIKQGTTKWERCKYTAVVPTTGNAGYLTIVRSGAEHGSNENGVAQAWPAGSVVYLSIGEYEMNAVKGNIEDHESRLAAAVSAIAGKEPANANIQGHIASTSNPHLEPRENLIINGDFSIAQRCTSYTSTTWRKNDDDSYLLDQWLLLSDGNDVVDVTQIEGAFSRSRYALQAEVETANKRFGLCQIIEADSCIPYRGQNISISIAAKTVAAKLIENIRVVVLEWTGTANQVTSDVVSVWGAEGSNPTWATSWAALNSPENLALTTSEQTYKVENLTVCASCNNIAVFVWVDDGDASVDDILQLGEVQIVRGSVAPEFVARDDYDKCLDFFEKSYGYATTPGAANAVGSYSTYVFAESVNNGATWRVGMNPRFKAEKFTSPTVTLFSYEGTPGIWNIGGTNRATIAYSPTPAGFGLQNNTGGSVTPTAGSCYGHYIAEAVL